MERHRQTNVLNAVSAEQVCAAYCDSGKSGFGVQRITAVMEFGGRADHEIKERLIVVKDIEKSKQFYHNLFGL